MNIKKGKIMMDKDYLENHLKSYEEEFKIFMGIKDFPTDFKELNEVLGLRSICEQYSKEYTERKDCIAFINIIPD
ncbi:MAG: hypothetical protein ACK5LC_12500 [Coprobacillaceae bacterium]